MAYNVPGCKRRLASPNRFSGDAFSILLCEVWTFLIILDIVEMGICKKMNQYKYNTY
jgi:hypothetical protein